MLHYEIYKKNQAEWIFFMFSIQLIFFLQKKLYFYDKNSPYTIATAAVSSFPK